METSQSKIPQEYIRLGSHAGFRSAELLPATLVTLGGNAIQSILGI